MSESHCAVSESLKSVSFQPNYKLILTYINVEELPKTLKFCGEKAARILTYVWPFFIIMNEKIKGDFLEFDSCFDYYGKRY